MASEKSMSEAVQQPEASAMIEALKRTLVSMANELEEAKGKLTQAESTLEVEKREHQLTTTKLTTLLRKRTAQAGAPAPTEDASMADVGVLHQQIGILQQQLRSSQQSELQMREQLTSAHASYEKLRMLTLDGFRAQREAAVGGTSTGAPAAAAAAAAAPAVCVESSPTTSIAPPMAPQAVRDAVRMALQPQRAPPSVLCAELWRRPTEHAQPRVGMPRSRSDLSSSIGDHHVPGAAAASSPARRGSGAATLGGAPMSRSMSEMSVPKAPRSDHARMGATALAMLGAAGSANLPSSTLPCCAPSSVLPSARVNALAPAAAASALAACSAVPTVPLVKQISLPLPVAAATVESDTQNAAQNSMPSPLPSPLPLTSKVSFGYVKGAISVEPPKRQRTTVSSISPRQSL